MKFLIGLLILFAAGFVQAKEQVILQLKWHHQFQFAGYYAAQFLGYYEQAGLNVHIKPLEPGSDPTQEVTQGRAAFGIASTDLLLMRHRGEPVVALASIFQHSPYVLLAMRRNGIETIHDLVGKKVLIDPYATEVLAYMRTMGLPVDRMNLIKSSGYTYQALVEGQADAYAGYLTNDPFYLDMVGADYLTFTPRASGIDFYGDTLYTTESQIRDHPERVQSFVAASLKGWEYAMAHPAEVIEWMIAKGWAQAQDREKLLFEAHKVQQLIRPDLVPIGYMHEGRWRHVVNIYADLGMLPRNLSLQGFLYGQNQPGLPTWTVWTLGLLTLLALSTGSFAVYAYRARKRFDSQVTQRRRAENAELKLAGAVYQSLGDALLITDDQNRIVSPNQAFVQMTGYEPSILSGLNPCTLLTEDCAHLFERIERGLIEVGQWSGSVSIVHRDGHALGRHLFVRVIKDENGQPLRHVCIFSALEQDKSKDDLVWNTLHLDVMTGLPNRRLFMSTLHEWQERFAVDPSRGFALMFIDIDRFQEVNELLGHALGDSILMETAKRLRACLDPQSFLGRMGGDEFAIITPLRASQDDIDHKASAILRQMSEPFELANFPIYLTVSLGIATYPHDCDSVERLLQLSEQAMYAAKDSGRNRRVYFSASMQDQVSERARLTNDLRRAFDNGDLYLEYQPIVSLRTGAVVKAEALLRWRHSEEGLITPDRFIPIAERSGLIVPIGRWAFREACRQLSVWNQWHPLQVSINKSPYELRDAESTMADDLAFAKQCGVPGGAIAIEITEGVLLDTSGTVSETLSMLRASGVHLSLDDFGTGYSSMAYLQKIDIGFIKIDKTFVRDLDSNPGDQTLCRSIIMMAHGLGIKVVAEGVERIEQVELLSAMGCDYAQGFYYSMPLGAEAFGQYLTCSLAPTALIETGMAA